MMKIATPYLGGRFSTSLLNDTVREILLFVVVCSFITGTQGCRNCTSSSLRFVQVACRSSNDKLLVQAEKFDVDRDSSSFCSSLFDFYDCVGRQVPECLVTMQEQYHVYFQSPYECHPTPNDTLRLQTYLRNMCIMTTDIPKTSTSQSAQKGQLSTTIIISTLLRGSSTARSSQVNPSNSAFQPNISYHLIAWCLIFPYLLSKRTAYS